MIKDNKLKYLAMGIFLFMVLVIASLSVLLSKNKKTNENGEPLIISVPTITPYPGNQLGKISVIPDKDIPTAPPTPIPGEGDIILSGIAVNNFQDTSESVGNDGNAVIEKTDNYTILFTKNKELFEIVVSDKRYKELAEEQLVKELGLDKINACRISVTVAVEGVTYPLSYCTDSGEGNSH